MDVEGTVVIAFTVTKTGELKDFEIAQGIGHYCDQYALKYTKQHAEYSIGTVKGKPVDVRLGLPFFFK